MGFVEDMTEIYQNRPGFVDDVITLGVFWVRSSNCRSITARYTSTACYIRCIAVIDQQSTFISIRMHESTLLKREADWCLSVRRTVAMLRCMNEA